MPLEREHKFLLTEPPNLEALRQEFDARGFNLESPPPRDQVDRYFDTPEGDLKRAGVALRIRQFDAQTFATFKVAGTVAGSLHSREELELPFEPPWPAPILERVEALVAPESLRPVLELRTRRTRYSVKQGEVRVAELSFDAVRARKPDARKLNGPHEVSFQELELEALGEASEEAFARVAETLETCLPLQPGAQTKLERAHTLLEST